MEATAGERFQERCCLSLVITEKGIFKYQEVILDRVCLSARQRRIGMDTDTPDGFEYPDIDEEQFEIGSQHDAEMIAQHTRHGALIKWSWTDGRRTVTPTEHDEINWATEEAEDRHPPEELESGTVVAKVWMDDDETIDEMEWQDA